MSSSPGWTGPCVEWRRSTRGLPMRRAWRIKSSPRPPTCSRPSSIWSISRKIGGSSGCIRQNQAHRPPVDDDDPGAPQDGSVFRQARVDLVHPCVNSTHEVGHAGKALVSQHQSSTVATGSRTAVHDDLPVRRELVQTVLKFSEGNHHRPIRLQIHDLPLMRLSHVQQKRRLRRRQALLELDGTDLTNWIFHPLLLSLSGCIQPAEIFIVDESGLCRLIATKPGNSCSWRRLSLSNSSPSSQRSATDH